MCISSAIEIARLQLSPHFPVKYKTEDISKLPMGILVSIFSKINTDISLHTDLKDITRDRNDVAHRSLLFTLGELRNKKHMAKATQKLQDVRIRATKIHNRLLDIRYALLRSLSKMKLSANI
jgi:HEAT repeat protein